MSLIATYCYPFNFYYFNEDPFISFYLTFFYEYCSILKLYFEAFPTSKFSLKNINLVLQNVPNSIFTWKWQIFTGKWPIFLANNGLNNLTPSDRAKLAENRQVMKAYLISKLVAPRYEVDESGRINPEHFKKGHLGSTEYHQRQRTVQ